MSWLWAVPAGVLAGSLLPVLILAVVCYPAWVAATGLGVLAGWRYR